MPLRPLEDIIGPLVVPVRGKEYALPAVSVADGAKIHASRSSGAALEYQELYRIILGDVHEQMIADHVPGDVVDRVFLAAYTDFTSGRESAEEVWENGIPKALRDAAKEVLAAMNQPAAEATAAPKAKPSRSRAGRSKQSGGTA